MANKFTNREKKVMLYAGLFFFLLLLMWTVFAPDRGIVDMLQTTNRLEKLQAENQKLAEENKALRQEIDKLKNDPDYLEEKVRKEYGMLKENEVLYKFNKDKK
jgi:cell division protein FtsB